MKKFFVLLLLTASLFVGLSVGKANAAYWTWSGALGPAGIYSPNHYYYKVQLTYQQPGGCADVDNYIVGNPNPRAGFGSCHGLNDISNGWSYTVGSGYLSYFKAYCWTQCWLQPIVGITAWYNP